MDTIPAEPHPDNQSVSPKRKSLSRLYDQVTQYEYTDPDHAYQMFESVVWDLGNYTASPDLWHNATMVAARAKHAEAELALIQHGLREWPDDVDLLCDEFQLRYSSHYDLSRAQEIWEKLETMPVEMTGPYWRFWVYGAIYHATRRNDGAKALELLDRGLRFVKRDGLQDLLRSYRRVLVDSVPRRPLENVEQVKEYQRETLKLLEDRYKLGIELGVENGYVLATELAELYQERAIPLPDQVVIHGGSSPTEDSQNENVDNLKQALAYLELAEKRFTGNPNHPILDIYLARARILMAVRRYGEALTLLRSLPQSILQERSNAAMLHLAALGTGQTEEPKEVVSLEKALSIAVPYLLRDGGKVLFALARQDPDLESVVIQAAIQLQQDKERSERG